MTNNKNRREIEFKDICYDCGVKLYPENKKNALDGIGISFGKCPECKKDGVGIIPARDWRYRAGLFRKLI